MKIPGWEKRLIELIEKASKQPFQYGSFDCCLFACDAVHVLTDIDIRGEIIVDTYEDEEGAKKVLEKYGGIEGIARMMVERFGFPEVPVLFAQRGDIVMAEIKGIQSLGVCTGKNVAFPKPEGGLVYIDITSRILKKAWHI